MTNHHESGLWRDKTLSWNPYSVIYCMCNIVRSHHLLEAQYIYLYDGIIIIPHMAMIQTK